MKNILYVSLFLLFLAGFANQANGSKFMGSDLTWSCVGQDSFLVKMVVYRDCNGLTVGSGSIVFKCATTGASITSLGFNPGTPVDVTPVCRTSCTRCQSLSCSFPYGIHRYTFQGIVRLNGAGSCCNISVTFEQCCRNAAITTGAAGTNFYTTAMLNRCQNPCNNSPTISNAPVAILCVGQDFSYYPDIHDVDVDSNGALADSLTYEWTQPLSGSNNPIAYTGQYAYNKSVYFWGFPNNALPFPRGIHLDGKTGNIQFRPMKAEVTVMMVKINEYRQGVKIGELRHEMQIVVITCTNNNPPMVTTPNNVKSKSVCAGDTVTFNFSSTDPNATDSVKISWDHSLPGAIWTDSNGLSLRPSAVLKWVPDSSYVSSFPYTFLVTVRDNACPIAATYVQAYQITVKPKPEASIIVADSGCGNIWITAKHIIGLGPGYYWQGQSNSFFPKYGSGTQQKLQPGIYPFTMTMVASGCSNIYYDTLTIAGDSFVTVKLPPDTSLCSGSTISITPRIFFNHGPLHYSWSTGDTTPVLHFTASANSDFITLTVEDSSGCTSTDTIIITGLKHPEIYNSYPVEVCYTGNYPVTLSPTYQFFGSTNYISSFNWHKSGDTTTLSTGKELNTTDTGIFIFSITDAFGCQFSNSFAILNSVKNPEISMKNKAYICYNNISNITITPNYKVFGNDYIKAFKWQFSSDTTTLSDQSNLITKDTGIYRFTITDKFGCVASDSVSVELSHPIDTSLTVNGFILTAGAGMKRYEWYRNDTLIHSGITVVYIAPGNGNYYAVFTDTNNCVDTSRTVTIFITGINSRLLYSDIKIYPNPTTGKLILEATNAIKSNLTLNISDIFGKVILQQTLEVKDLQTAREIDI